MIPEVNAALNEAELASGVYAKKSIEIISGRDCHIWDSSGKMYIDMGASFGVCNVGHSNPEVLEAIKRQAENIIYISSTYPNPVRRELMEKVISISPKGTSRCFLSNSGTESIEAALKFAILRTSRTGIVAAMRSFHGRTFGALAATWNKKHRAGLEEVLMPVKFVKYDDVEQIKEAVDKNTAAVLLEPVQGEGGVFVPSKGYFRAVKDICEDNGALLIVDEVQTGLGRTGTMFCIEQHNISPDIMCIGKSLGGGLPIAATVIHERLGSMKKGSHGSTFGGNPLTCAAAYATIDFLLKKNLPDRAEKLGQYFKSRLIDLSSNSNIIREVRGLGLMLAVELKTKNAPYLNKLIESGIAPLPGGATNIRFLPPLVIEKDDITKTIAAFEEALLE